MEKQILVFISHTWRSDHTCDRDIHIALTITQCTLNAEEQTTFFKWMSKDYHGEVAKFAELRWFHSIAKQSNLAEQWKDAHLVGKLKRADEHLLVIKGLSRSARAGRGHARGEKWNLDSVKAVLNRIQEETRVRKSTHQWPDRSTSRIKCWTNTVVHRSAQDAPGIQEHTAEHDLRLLGPKSLLKQKLQVTLRTAYCRVQEQQDKLLRRRM